MKGSVVTTVAVLFILTRDIANGRYSVQHNEQICCQTCLPSVREEYWNSYYGLVTPCNLVGRNQHLGENSFLHNQGRNYVLILKDWKNKFIRDVANYRPYTKPKGIKSQKTVVPASTATNIKSQKFTSLWQNVRADGTHSSYSWHKVHLILFHVFRSDISVVFSVINKIFKLIKYKFIVQQLYIIKLFCNINLYILLMILFRYPKFRTLN